MLLFQAPSLGPLHDTLGYHLPEDRALEDPKLWGRCPPMYPRPAQDHKHRAKGPFDLQLAKGRVDPPHQILELLGRMKPKYSDLLNPSEQGFQDFMALVLFRDQVSKRKWDGWP